MIRSARQTITRQWWDDRRESFDLFISQLVVKEANAGDKMAAERRKRILDGLALLEVTDDAIEVAAKLVDQGLMPPNAADDALHLAISAVQGIDFLLTWNCRHLANAEIMGAMADALAAEGYHVPLVCTPDGLMGE